MPIPTSSAAGQSMAARPRTKLVQRKNWLSAISLRNKVGGTTKRKNKVAILQAAKQRGVAFLVLGNRKGLFRVTGTKRGLKVRMLWDLSHPSVVTPATHTLARTLKAIQPRLGALHEKAIVDQLKRNRIFGYR